MCYRSTVKQLVFNNFRHFSLQSHDVRHDIVQGKEKVLITHAAIPQVALDVLKDKFEVVVVKGVPNPTREELLKTIEGCAGVLWYGHIKVDREMIDAAETKWLMNHPTWMVGQGISNKTVGILGLGQNGFAIAKRMVGFEINRILYNDLINLKEKAQQVNAELVSKETLFKESDILFLAVPLTNLTKGIINEKTLNTMKKTCILINTARGEVINQDDLIEALQQKIIWGAGLDVMYPEPLPPDHPLTKLPNCVLTPHIGSRTVDTRIAMYVLAARNILNALTGQPLVTPLY